MSITFEDGVNDNLILEPFFQGTCNFIGKLQTTPKSTAAVTGCLEKKGDKMSITLLSSLNTDFSMFELDFDGNLRGLHNPFQHQTG